MPTCAIFCTVELSLEDLASFEKLSTSGKTMQNIISPWFFIKGPSSLNPTNSIPPTIGTPLSSFPTEFLSASASTLQEFFDTLFEDKTIASPYPTGNPLSPNTFTVKSPKSPIKEAQISLSYWCYIVLDKHSIRDQTCEIWYRHQYMPEPPGYIGDPIDWDEEKGVTEGRVWRIKYRTAWYFLTYLWHVQEEIVRALDQGGTRETYVDDKGVLRLAGAERDEWDHLEDRAPFRSRKPAKS